MSVSCRVDGETAQVSFTTFRRTLIQQIMDSSLAFFKLEPRVSQSAQLLLASKQVLSFTPHSTVEDLKLTTPDRQSLELVLLEEVRDLHPARRAEDEPTAGSGPATAGRRPRRIARMRTVTRARRLPPSPPKHARAQEPEVTFPVRDQYGHEVVLRARLYHPFVDAVRRLLDPDSPALQAQPQAQQPAPAAAAAAGAAAAGANNANSSSSSGSSQQNHHGLDVDVYRSSDVSLISLQNSPAACGLQGGEPLLLYRYGRCSREYWQAQGQPDKALKPTFAGLYISDFKNQVGTTQRRAEQQRHGGGNGCGASAPSGAGSPPPSRSRGRSGVHAIHGCSRPGPAGRLWGRTHMSSVWDSGGVQLLSGVGAKQRCEQAGPL